MLRELGLRTGFKLCRLGAVKHMESDKVAQHSGMHTGMWWNITTCELHRRCQVPCVLLCEATSNPLISCWCTSVWSPENNWYVNAVFQKSIYFRVRVRVRVRSHVSALGCTRVHLGHESKLGCRRMHLKVKVHEQKRKWCANIPKNGISLGIIC